MDVNNPELGVINKIRLEAGVTVDGLAERAGIPRSTLQRRLADEDDFSLYQLRKIARVFGMKFVDLAKQMDAAR